MIIPTDENDQIVPRFVSELPDDEKQIFLNLRDFCLTKVDTLLYVVYTTDIDRLDIQSIDGDVVCLVVEELDPSDKETVNAALEECLILLNN